MKNLSINKKLMVMLIVPVLALLFFAGISVIDRMAVAEDMEELQQMSEVAAAVNNLVHQLQIERGLSAGYLGSDGRDFSDELVAHRTTTDGALTEFEEVSQLIDLEEQGGEIREHHQQAIQQLNELANRRDAISGQQMTSQEAINYYSATIQDLISVVSSISAVLTDAELAHRFSSYIALMLEKEYAGIERATLNSAFVANRFADAEHYQRFVEVVSKQEAYEQLFLMSALASDQQLVQEALGSGGERDQMRNHALERGVDAQLDVAASDWFRVSTDYIDDLHVAETNLTNSILERSEELRANAQNAFYVFLILTLIAVVLAIGITQWIGRSISNPLSETSASAQAVAQQLVATASQQSASVSETATAVSQTSTTVDELRQTSEVAAERSDAVREKSEKSVVASDEALSAISDGITAMNRIREEVEGIAQNILELSEKNIQVGEIVQSVGAIAEQSNLLAVNASIEAAQAGEHGKGFSVVASEVKALAAQSKEATAQIRSILSEIQKSSNAAVMVTEQGTKRVEESASLIEELGDTVRTLGESVEDSLEASMQISATASQQLTGIEEITAAMTNIEQATQENAVGTRQLESAAKEVEEMSEQLDEIVNGASAAA